jgi:para-aminobenzoate synthetase component 1
MNWPTNGERLPTTRWNDFPMPVLAVGLYDVVVAFDHQQGRAWIISQGFPEQEPNRRLQRAQERLQEWKSRLGRPGPPQENRSSEGRILCGATQDFPGGIVPDVFWPERDVPRRGVGSAAGTLPGGPLAAVNSLLLPEELAPQYPVEGLRPLTSNFTPTGYQEAVRRVKEYICAGDVFQVNLSQRLLLPAQGPAWELYLRLRVCHPAPFAGYFDLGRFQILSASPERFLWVQGGQVETRPIKGTRPRTGCTTKDRAAVQELLNSQKDRAENVMIVDLLRNDLSRVCRPESIRVGQLCGLESYSQVFHLVSAVRGQLRPECSPIDLVRACFPGGSVTGAPKVRAMEIIAELGTDRPGRPIAAA